MPLDLKKLAKVCEMLGSDFPDERATAAAIAHNMVRSSGHTWIALFAALEQAAGRIAELQERATTPPDWHHVDAWREPQTIAEAIEACLSYPNALNDWEQAFLVNVSGRARLSPKQIDALHKILAKARAAARLAGNL